MIPVEILSNKKKRTVWMTRKMLVPISDIMIYQKHSVSWSINIRLWIRTRKWDVSVL